jgi:DNA polymerase V
MASNSALKFPSPADDFIEDTIDLNDLLIHNRPATYLVRVSGTSMQDAAICNGDLLVVDASLRPSHNKIVVAAVDGEFLVKRFFQDKGETWLKAENSEYAPIKINPEDDFTILGVVTGVIRQVT